MNTNLVKADEVEVIEVDDPAINQASVNDPDPDNQEPDIQDNEVLNSEENPSHEESENDPEGASASDPDDGQLRDLVQELADSVVTYINFSYKMQIVNVAMLAVIAGSGIAFSIFNHFRD